MVCDKPYIRQALFLRWVYMYLRNNGSSDRRVLRMRRGRILKKTAAGLAAAAIICCALLFLQGRGGKIGSAEASTASGKEAAVPAETMSPEAQAEAEHQQAIDAVIAGYQDLGIITVEGYLNLRAQGAQNADVIGKLYGGSACEILERGGDGWLHISSGGIEGYVHEDYVKTGDEAKALAREQVTERAIVNADKLYIRAEPSTEAEAVGTALQNERYAVQEKQEGWVKTAEGWMSADYLTVQPALNEARKLDLRSMVLNMYDNLGVSEVSNYLNIREEPKEDGKIIGKMTSKAGCDILETAGDWFKIRSGDITGYVKAEYIATGQQARDDAVANATLMAIVNTDVLNARAEPKEEAQIWTQITNSERYPVVEQLDGWVKIELEEDDNVFVKSEYVDVRYALNEAIHFSPAEEAAQQSLSRRQQIVNYALQFLGNPYVWGGTSLTNGCDCSGFTMRIMEQFGVSLPHYSGSQAQLGKKVSSAEMRPGDLVFYSNSGGRINHVGIYIGNGQIVNAASRRSGIKISSWNYRTPRAIRNVLGD